MKHNLYTSLTRRSLGLIRELTSDNGAVHENVTEKTDLASFYTFSRPSQFALLLKRRGFWLELKREERAQVRTEMVEFIALPVPVPK